MNIMAASAALRHCQANHCLFFTSHSNCQSTQLTFRHHSSPWTSSLDHCWPQTGSRSIADDWQTLSYHDHEGQSHTVSAPNGRTIQRQPPLDLDLWLNDLCPHSYL